MFGRVVLVQTLMDGTIMRRRLPVWFAVHLALWGPANGVTVRSARVEFGRVPDRWGTSGAGARPEPDPDLH